MSVLGIIAEYNPFHLGHRYHLEQAQAATGAEATIAVISGHFSQRGEPAIFDKWLRAEMALLNGVDLVLELPTVFACRSAHYFALGAVLSLAQTQVITHFSFGSESTDLKTLSAIAALLAEESPAYHNLLQNYLAQGLAFPRAQQLAINDLLGPQEISLNQPNTILALNYLKILQHYHLPLIPVVIKRQGSYHSQNAQDGLASASALRRMLLDGTENWQSFVPENCTSLVTRHRQAGFRPIQMTDFTQGIFTILRRSSAADLRRIIEMTEGLENKLLTTAGQCRNLPDLYAKLKSKRYPYTRLTRLLCHILLNFTKDYSFAQPAYLRVLGFNTVGQQLLRRIKQQSKLPLITKVAAAKAHLNAEGQQMLAMDCRATDLYCLANQKSEHAISGQDFYRSPVILTN